MKLRNFLPKKKPKLQKGESRREKLIRDFRNSKMPDKFQEPRKENPNKKKKNKNKNKKGNK